MPEVKQGMGNTRKRLVVIWQELEEHSRVGQKPRARVIRNPLCWGPKAEEGQLGAGRRRQLW